MFGNYSTMAHRHIQADVGFFDARGDEEAFLKAKPPLSEEIIQSYKPQSPWSSSPTFEGDFVLVCEFSELEGPKPVMTVPKDSGGDFDQNEFALKIMAVDYNATNIVRSGGSFSLVEDTGIILEEPKESAFAYVHHFTLYDVIARGYVRPFCMAYITSDQRKIIRNLEWLTTQFGKVSKSFCFGNRCQFQRDLKCRLADIHYTMEDLQNQHLIGVNGTTTQVHSPDDNDGEAKRKSNQKYSALEKGVHEVQEILDILAQELINPKQEAQFERLEKLACAKNLSMPRRHHNSSSIHEEGYHSDGEEKTSKESGKRTVRRISTCDSLNDLQSSLETPTSYTPQIIRVDGYRKFDIRLRTLHELCGWGYKVGLSRVRKMHKHLSRNPLILYMEKKESKLVDPTTALLTIGRAVTMNFMQDISLQCMAYSECCQEDTDTQCNAALRRLTSNISTSSASPSLEENLVMKQPSLSYDEARFVPGTAYASMESLYYDVNESLDHSSDDDDEIPKKSLSNCTFILSGDGSWVDITSKEYDYSSSTDTSTSLPFKGRHFSKAGDNPSDEVDDSTSEREVISQDYVVYSNSASTSSSMDQLQDSPIPTTTADSYIVRRHEKVSVGSYVSRINSFNTCLPGSGVRNIIGQYSFAIHLVYALLSGRTVIVVASPRYEKEVTALIRTLWLFVPGHSSKHLVVPWHTQPVCLLDLSCMKLIGLSRHKSTSPIIPADVEKNSTVFDYETSILRTPPYKGFYLNLLIKSCKHFRTDRAYIAFIHSHFLELAQKAYVYYHSYCLNSPNFQPITGNSNEVIKMGNCQIKNASIGYLSKLSITDGDVDIIEYWVEIIKQQQIDKVCLQAVSTVIPPPSVCPDHRQCKMYQV